MTHVSRPRTVDVLVIGAGHAGLSISYHLTKAAVDHVVMERGEVANSWKTGRWDSLSLLTPNWMFELPGKPYNGSQPDNFMAKFELVDQLSRYATDCSLPVQTHTEIQSVVPASGGYRVTTNRGEWQARSVVLANGAFTCSVVPSIGSALPPQIFQTAADQYRNPNCLPEGGVLVVGASATGLQLAREIQRSGRAVKLAVGEHIRMPRTYRDHDIFYWLQQIGLLSEGYKEVEDLKRARRLPSPQLVGDSGHSLDLNGLQDLGIELLGRLVGCNNSRLQFSGSLPNHCKLADLKLARMLRRIDEYIDGKSDSTQAANTITATRLGNKPRLLVQCAEIKSVVWATGFKPDLSWLNAGVLNPKGQLQHDGGVLNAPGLYTIGYPLLRQRRSSYLQGISRDAGYISEQVCSYLNNTTTVHHAA